MGIILLVFKIEGNIPENKDWWKRIASWSEMREVIIIFFFGKSDGGIIEATSNVRWVSDCFVVNCDNSREKNG